MRRGGEGLLNFLKPTQFRRRLFSLALTPRAPEGSSQVSQLWSRVPNALPLPTRDPGELEGEGEAQDGGLRNQREPERPTAPRTRKGLLQPCLPHPGKKQLWIYLGGGSFLS